MSKFNIFRPRSNRRFIQIDSTVNTVGATAALLIVVLLAEIGFTGHRSSLRLGSQDVACKVIGEQFHNMHRIREANLGSELSRQDEFVVAGGKNRSWTGEVGYERKC